MTGTTLAFSPLVGTSALIGLAVLLTGVIAYAALRRLPGWPWRLLAGVTVRAVLTNPSLVREEREPLSDIALLVTDDSVSMDIPGRRQAGEATAQALRAAAGADPLLDLVEITGGRAEDGTRLVETITDGLADIPRGRLAGIVAVSDGQVHDLPEDPGALSLTAPLHHFAAGSAEAGDRRLVIEEAPRYGLVGDPVSFTLRVEDPAAAEGSAEVTLRVDGGDPITARVAIGRTVNVEAEVRHRGANVVEIEVEPGREELSLLNNRAAVSVTGVRDRLRVLLVTGEPHNGARAWRDLLKSDPSVDLVHFTILRPLDKQDATPPDELALIAFPVFELFQQRLEEFDLVIFDRYRRRGILSPIYIGNIARYVENGGALLVTTGPPFAGPASLARSQLASVLPARPNGQIAEERFTPQVSETGARHPVTAPMAGREASWGPWFRRIGAIPISGETVLESPDGEPLLILSRQEQGRTAILMSDQAWLWERGFEGGGPHDELFRRVAHWLMGEPELDEERLSASVSAGELIATRSTLADSAPPLEIVWPSGAEQSAEMTETGPGRFEARLGVEETGLIRLRSGELTTVVSAGPLNPREYEDLTVDTDGLAALVDASGGGVFEVGAGESVDLPQLRRTRPGSLQHGEDWAGLQRNGAYEVAEARRMPLTPGLLAVLVLLALIGLAWRREGR